MAALSARLGRDFEVDVFQSVGSQVAVFEEMKVFAASNPNAVGKTPRPASAQRWWCT